MSGQGAPSQSVATSVTSLRHATPASRLGPQGLVQGVQDCPVAAPMSLWQHVVKIDHDCPVYVYVCMFTYVYCFVMQENQEMQNSPAG